MTDRQITQIKVLRQHLAESFSSLDVLFPGSGSERLNFLDAAAGNIADRYLAVLKAVTVELEDLAKNPAGAVRRRFAPIAAEDSLTVINALAAVCGDEPFAVLLERAILDALTSRGHLAALADAGPRQWPDDAVFSALHAIRLLRRADLVPRYLRLLDGLDPVKTGLKRISPAATRFFKNQVRIQSGRRGITPETVKILSEKAMRADPFRYCRTFRCAGGECRPVMLDSIRAVNDFYGYEEVRKVFHEHFAAFAAGQTNLPLLVSSLPGLGKTHFSIAFALEQPELVLVLAEPADIELRLENLIKRFAARKDRRFVLFFDDLDPKEVDWYCFRTNVGGSFILPDNVTVVIASNFEFPANICSRGRGVTFPIFDEIVCQEMTAAFLVTIGMSHPPADLIAVIAADYVEEFALKKFQELSPRTLVRYLNRYKSDPRKRRRMLEMSRAEVIVKPDAEVFMDFNVKIIRALYGENAINELRDEKLRNLLIT